MIRDLVLSGNYFEIERISHEDDLDPESIEIDFGDVKQKSTRWLENKMDEPFYRFSRMENYVIQRE